MRSQIPRMPVAYTFIFGDYDTLKTPTVITAGWDYICFTDNPRLRSRYWDVRLSTRTCADRELEDKKFAIKHMILSHNYLPDHELALSFGGHIQINCNLDEFVGKHFPPGADLMICRHPERDCIYEEAQVCQALGKDDQGRIAAQMRQYRGAGYPAHKGLYDTIVIGRRDSPGLRAMCETWFREYERGSSRDHLCLNYALWRSAPLSIAELDYHEQFCSSQNFIIWPHLGPFPELNPFHDETRFDNGVPISLLLVALYIHTKGSLERWPEPQITRGADSFFTWVNAPAGDDPCRGPGPRITNLATFVYRARADVQRAFPEPFLRDRSAFANWFLTYARQEYDLPDALCLPLRDSHALDVKLDHE
jgi:alkaline ceramidase TOD1/glycosyltransferase MUCI70-like protein